MKNINFYCYFLSTHPVDGYMEYQKFIDLYNEIELQTDLFDKVKIKSDNFNPEFCKLLIYCPDYFEKGYVIFNSFDEFYNFFNNLECGNFIFPDSTFNQAVFFKRYLLNEKKYTFFNRGDYSGPDEKYVIGSDDQFTVYLNEKCFNFYNVYTYSNKYLNLYKLNTTNDYFYCMKDKLEFDIWENYVLKEHKYYIDHLLEEVEYYANKLKKAPFTMLHKHWFDEYFKPQKKPKKINIRPTLEKLDGWTINEYGKYLPIMKSLTEKEKKEYLERKKLEPKKEKIKKEISKKQQYTLDDLNKLRDEEVGKDNNNESNVKKENDYNKYRSKLILFSIQLEDKLKKDKIELDIKKNICYENIYIIYLNEDNIEKITNKILNNEKILNAFIAKDNYKIYFNNNNESFNLFTEEEKKDAIYKLKKLKYINLGYSFNKPDEIKGEKYIFELENNDIVSNFKMLDTINTDLNDNSIYFYYEFEGKNGNYLQRIKYNLEEN